VFSWAMVLLFGYGVHGLIQLYMRTADTGEQGVKARFAAWWARSVPFERKWLAGSVVLVILSLIGWFTYSAFNGSLAKYIATVGISSELAPEVARYSLGAAGWFVLLLVITVLILLLIFSGQFAGPRARWGLLLVGAFVVADLARADKPWIVYWNVPYKYESDSIIRFLADKPYEHRVSLFPVNVTSRQHAILFTAYGSHWKQQLFPYNNIQCAEVVQEPRPAEDKEEFMSALPQNTLFGYLRFWQLSSTRYILGPAGDLLTQMGPAGRAFHVLKRFSFEPKRPNPSDKPVDYKAVEDPNGELAVYEFTEALPRAKLFPGWQVNTNDESTLRTIGDPAFDPLHSVLVANTDMPASAPADASQAAGSVEITNYKPNHIELSADVKEPSVLLLTDRFDPKWSVKVDGKPAELLRCDFILRGVHLERGNHKIVMQFSTPLTMLYVSLATILVGFIFAGVLIVTRKRDEASAV
jgi:Bacterial membrane protein YfhO